MKALQSQTISENYSDQRKGKAWKINSTSHETAPLMISSKIYFSNLPHSKLGIIDTKIKFSQKIPTVPKEIKAPVYYGFRWDLFKWKKHLILLMKMSKLTMKRTICRLFINEFEYICISIKQQQKKNNKRTFKRYWGGGGCLPRPNVTMKDGLPSKILFQYIQKGTRMVQKYIFPTRHLKRQRMAPVHSRSQTDELFCKSLFKAHRILNLFNENGQKHWGMYCGSLLKYFQKISLWNAYVKKKRRRPRKFVIFLHVSSCCILGI